MAILSVNPTRMELQVLKGKLATSRRGHKLLKDKCDELMRRFMAQVRENKALRQEVEAELADAQRRLSRARARTGGKVMDAAMLLPRQEVNVTATQKNVMSVRIPQFEIHYKVDPGETVSYGNSSLSADTAEAVEALGKVLPKLLRLAEAEKGCQLMASEIEKTRRRVNALEHVMIPDYEDTIRFITMKLDENERSTTTRLMKVKDMMLAEKQAKKEARSSF